MKNSKSTDVFVIDDSSDDDEDNEVGRFSDNSNSNCCKRPSDIDQASWALIQRWREDDDDEIVDVSSLPLTTKLKFPRKLTSYHGDEKSLELALKLQAEEERRQRMQQEREQLDLGHASKLQHEEYLESHANRTFCTLLSKEEVLKTLVPCQTQAVEYIKGKAKFMHQTFLPLLERRVVSLGFTSDAMQECLEYIKSDAPIIIHLTQDTLPLVAKDTHYRNLFETNTSGGSEDKLQRQQWETDMFGNCYSFYCPHFDRPKYGCLNITGDIAGVNSARRYGECFLILHQHVRYRATFFDKDTNFFVASESLATNEYYAHILLAYSDEDLKAALNVSAASARIRGAPSKCSVYKEVQIHGPVCLTTDVQALSVPGRLKDASEKLQQDVWEFQKKTNCNVLWQGDLLNPDDATS